MKIHSAGGKCEVTFLRIIVQNKGKALRLSCYFYHHFIHAVVSLPPRSSTFVTQHRSPEGNLKLR